MICLGIRVICLRYQSDMFKVSRVICLRYQSDMFKVSK